MNRSWEAEPGTKFKRRPGESVFSPDERLVVIPRSMLIAAKGDIPLV